MSQYYFLKSRKKRRWYTAFVQWYLWVGVVGMILFTTASVYASGACYSFIYHTPEDVLWHSSLLERTINEASDINQGKFILPDRFTPSWVLAAIYRTLINNPMPDSFISEMLTTNEVSNDYSNYYELQDELETIIGSKITGKWESSCSWYHHNHALADYKMWRLVLPQELLREWVIRQNTILSHCQADDGSPIFFYEALTPQKTAIRSVTRKSLLNLLISKVRNWFKPPSTAVATSTPNLPEIFQPKTDLLESLAPSAIVIDQEASYAQKLKDEFAYQQAADAFYLLMNQNHSSQDARHVINLLEEIIANDNHYKRDEALFTLGRVYLESGDDAKAKAAFAQTQDGHYLLEVIDHKSDWYALMEISHDPEVLVRGANALTKNFTETSTSDFFTWLQMWNQSPPNEIEVIKNAYRDKQTDAWFLLLVKQISLDDELYPQLEKQVLGLTSASPIYWSANYWLIKKHLDNSSFEQAKRMIVRLPDQDDTPIIQNVLDNFRMLTADSLEDVFRFSSRNVIAWTCDSYFYDLEEDESKLRIDTKAKSIFNEHLTTETKLALVLQDDIFTPSQLYHLRLAMLTQAILLRDFKAAKQLARLVIGTDNALSQDLSEFLVATTSEDMEFYAVNFLLNNHQLNIKIETGNWHWSYLDDYYKQYPGRDTLADNCGIHGVYADTACATWTNKLKQFDPSNFFDEKTLEQKNQAQMKSSDFSQIVIAYAKKHPHHPAIPKALHQLVQISRYVSGKQPSQEPFAILHQQYPDDYWTKQTPYWYD